MEFSLLLTHFLIVFASWIIPAMILWKRKEGKKIYFINLGAGIFMLLIAGFIIKIMADNEPPQSGFNLGKLGYILAFACFYIAFLIWGIVLSFYSARLPKN